MNELSVLFSEIKDGEKIVLEHGREYHVYSADVPAGKNASAIFTKDENGQADHRFDMVFTPKYDRYSFGPKDENGMPVKPCSEQDQVFGKFNGTAVLDDGTVLEVKDFWGFAEFVRNHW